MFIPFGEYLPDLGEMMNPGVVLAKNVLPGFSYYETVYRTAAYSSNNIDAEGRGGAGFRSTAGTPFNFVGNATKLYSLTGGVAFDDVSRTAGGAYTTGSDEQWNFTAFGDRVIAANIADVLQSYVMGSSTDFAALAGSPPRARYITSTPIHVILGNVNDGTAYPSRVQWCKLGDPTVWTTLVADQSGYQDLPSKNGWVKQVVGGDVVTVFQEYGINIGTYVGGDQMYLWDDLDNAIGTRCPGSVVKTPVGIFYLGTDGFRILSGRQSVPIGVNKIDRTWADTLNADSTYKLSKIRAVLHPTKPLVLVFAPHATSSVILVYNYSPGANIRWSYIDNDASTGFDFDAYSAFVLIKTDGTPEIAIISAEAAGTDLAERYARTFTDTTAVMKVNIKTGLLQLKPGRISQLESFLPILDGTALATPVSGTNISYATGLPVMGSTTAGAFDVDSRGVIYLRKSGLFHQINFFMSNIDGKFYGIQLLDAKDVGGR